MNHPIIFLGPVGATFSHDAYNILSSIYDTPPANRESIRCCIPASSNGEILKLIARHGGYGAIAMETLAEGRVTEPLESFIDLLRMYEKTRDCPFHVAGAIGLKLHFALMTKHGVAVSEIKKIIAHPKALGACFGRITELNVETSGVSSNGEAARLVAESNEHAYSGALGPLSAAEKYGLCVRHNAFEDSVAITTFFLITPRTHPAIIGKQNRILIVYKVPHSPGALVSSLLPFEEEGLNLIQIHSVHAGNHTYNFAIELEVEERKLSSLKKAMATFDRQVTHHLSFGPFQVLGR